MAAAPLVDPHGRTVRDLRISVPDRCNLRCRYCMPAEGMDWLARSDLLSYEEIERVARVCVERFDFTGIRLTGGEPTVRAHLPVLVEKLARLGTDLSLTTNGATFSYAVSVGEHGEGVGQGHGPQEMRGLPARGPDVEAAVGIGRGHHPDEVELAVGPPGQRFVGHRRHFRA